jgi:hypothetical protein
MIGAKEWTMPERATTLSGGGAWRDAEDIKIMSIYVFVEVLGGNRRFSQHAEHQIL